MTSGDQHWIKCAVCSGARGAMEYGPDPGDAGNWRPCGCCGGDGELGYPNTEGGLKRAVDAGKVPLLAIAKWASKLGVSDEGRSGQTLRAIRSPQGE